MKAFMRWWRWHRVRTVPRWLADAHIHASVLVMLTRDAASEPELAPAYRGMLLEHARKIIEAIEGARRGEIPTGGDVLPFERRKS